MSKHTAGPWIVLPDLTVRVREWSKCAQMGDADGCIICDLKPALGVCDEDGERGQEAVDLARRVRAHAVAETDANARLIAAAPGLLEAARRALELFLEADWGGVNHPGCIVLDAGAVQRVREFLEAQIREAEGGAS